MLGWFCDQLTMVDRMLKGHVVSVMDLHDDALPDEVLDCNLSILKSFFDDEAWDQVLERGISYIGFFVTVTNQQD